VFVRRVVPGAADRSYGIQVARLAGLPRSVIDRASLSSASSSPDDTEVELPAPGARPKKKLYGEVRRDRPAGPAVIPRAAAAG